MLVRPLGRPALATQALLVIVALTDIALIAVLGDQRGLLQDLQTNPESVTLAEAEDSDDAVAQVSLFSLIAFVAAGVMYLVWFYRARANVDSSGAVSPRHGRGWAIGGWFVPFLNLIRPFQVTVDVLRASKEPPVPPGGVRQPQPDGGLGLLRWWWAAFLVAVVLSRLEAVYADRDTLDELILSTTFGIASSIVEIVGAVLAILVVRRITTAQHRRSVPLM